MRRALWLLPLGLTLLVGGYLWFESLPEAPSARSTLLLDRAAPTPEFSRATEVRPFTFPLDHGPHFDYQTEWWYYTGNLKATDDRHFAYQLTFFRRGLTPGRTDRPSAFATNQIYFAHLALTDVVGGQHIYAERFSRGAGGLAGASGDPYRVWLEDWSAEALDNAGREVRLRALEGDLRLDLRLAASKPLVLHGDQGLSAKSQQAGNASYYLSFTRMQTGGQLWLGDEVFQVAGESWFDHEWSTSALGEGAIGWDWLGLQLGDGSELMYFQIRREDGSLDPVSGGTLVEADGSTRTLSKEDAELETLSQWRSPLTSVVYPSGWRLSIPSAQIELTLEPWLLDQEMPLLFNYWEGAVRITGTVGGKPVSGHGFVELTGYDQSFQGVF